MSLCQSIHLEEGSSGITTGTPVVIPEEPSSRIRTSYTGIKSSSSGRRTFERRNFFRKKVFIGKYF